MVFPTHVKLLPGQTVHRVKVFRRFPHTHWGVPPVGMMVTPSRLLRTLRCHLSRSSLLILVFHAHGCTDRAALHGNSIGVSRTWGVPLSQPFASRAAFPHAHGVYLPFAGEREQCFPTHVRVSTAKAGRLFRQSFPTHMGCT